MKQKSILFFNSAGGNLPDIQKDAHISVGEYMVI
jgi:hypothetical protein